MTISIRDMADAQHLDVLGKRNWIARADNREFKAAPETIERKRNLLNVHEATLHMLEACAPFESEIRNLIIEKRGRG